MTNKYSTNGHWCCSVCIHIKEQEWHVYIDKASLQSRGNYRLYKGCLKEGKGIESKDTVTGWCVCLGRGIQLCRVKTTFPLIPLSWHFERRFFTPYLNIWYTEKWPLDGWIKIDYNDWKQSCSISPINLLIIFKI